MEDKIETLEKSDSDQNPVSELAKFNEEYRKKKASEYSHQLFMAKSIDDIKKLIYRIEQDPLSKFEELRLLHDRATQAYNYEK